MKSDSYQIKETDRILYIRLSAIGDVVNAIPGFIALREAYPKNFIAWCVEEKCADILVNHPDIDELLVIKDNWRKNFLNLKTWMDIFDFIRRMHKLRFNVAIGVHNLFKGGLTAYLSGAKFRIAANYNKNIEGYKKFFNILVNFKDIGPAAVRRAQFLKGLGIDISKLHYRLPDLADQKIRVTEMLHQVNILQEDLIIVLNPCASRHTKEWPGEHWVKLGQMLTKNYLAKIVWTGSKFDRSYIDNLRDQMVTSSVNFAGELNLLELAALYSQVDLLVSGDTGPLHIGAAVGTYVVGLYGSTNPASHGPFTERGKVLTSGISCQYCTGKTCEHVNCLKELLPETVFEEISKLSTSALWKREDRGVDNQ